jgi:hypothetical protein
MTREEFIDGYITRSELQKYRTVDGWAHNGSTHVALPCQCGEDGCDGWAMVSSCHADDVEWHISRLDENVAAAFKADPSGIDSKLWWPIDAKLKETV